MAASGAPPYRPVSSVHEAPHEPAPTADADAAAAAAVMSTATTAAAAAAAAAAVATDPFSLNDDGSACDPVAFQLAILGDADRLSTLEAQFPEFVELLRSDDLSALQDMLRRAMQAEKARLERMARRWPERSIDAQRASAPVPRDTVQVYKQLAEAGLEYGPAFRLLRNVHVPLTDK